MDIGHLVWTKYADSANTSRERAPQLRPSFHPVRGVVIFYLAVPRRQEKTYPAALPACPIDVGCLGGIMGGFELLPPVHVFRNVFEAPRHPIMSQCPVRHPAPLTWAR